MRRTFVIVINLAPATKIHAELVQAAIVAFDAGVLAQVSAKMHMTSSSLST